MKIPQNPISSSWNRPSVIFRRIFLVAFSILCVAGLVEAQTFSNFLRLLQNQQDSLSKSRLIDSYLASHAAPIVETTSVHFLYRGPGSRAAVPGDMNGWDPSKGMMERIDGTNLFVRNDSFPSDARVEYKIWVDSVWMLDPLNPRRAAGGFGENSDVWMPNCINFNMTEVQEDVPVGKLDTLWIESRFLHLKHPIVVYTPALRPGEKPKSLPLILVTDGIDYLHFAKMNVTLDNLIGLHMMKPVIAAFIDPRTDLHDESTNNRMSEYAASDAYLDFLEHEVLPRLQQSYPISHDAGDRMIMGASMGGLIATYAVLTRPSFVTKCGAQSPAYRQADSAVMKLASTIRKVNGSIYIQTGTIHDTQPEAKFVADRLKGISTRYQEIHEGHNWTNWRRNVHFSLEVFFIR